MSPDMLPAAETACRRAALFREPATARLRRWTLGTAWALQPERIGELPALARHCVGALATATRPLPDPREAGLRQICGLATDLSVPTLVAAYRRGLYPFAHVGPLKWHAPPMRSVLDFPAFHMSRRLRSRLRQQRHSVTFDRDFEAVITACAEPRPGKLPLTWITPRIMHAYTALHDAGFAHSFEVRDSAGTLVGGGYGVAVGGAFVIESQFARQTGASKIGFSLLVWHLAHWGFVLADNKLQTPNVAEMGFAPIPRDDYLARLAGAQTRPDRTGRWQIEADLDVVAAWQPDAVDASRRTHAA